MKTAKIIGLGSYFPKKTLLNKDFENFLKTTDKWIVPRTGINERRIASKNETTSEMGYLSSLKALEDAKIGIKDIDLILVATLTGDYIFPSTACIIQDKLKAYHAAAFDIQAACSGFVYALTVAKALVEQKTFKNILIVASEKLSSIIDYQDRATAVLFGDAASSCIVSLEGFGFEIIENYIGADGKMAKLLIMPAGGTKNISTIQTIENRDHFLKMNGKEVFKHAVKRMHESIIKCLKKASLNERDISWIVPHQANQRIIEAISKKFKFLPSNRIYMEVVKKFGNTSASSVGLALEDLKINKKFSNNENIVLTVFGAGFTFGSSLLKFKDNK